MGDMNLSPNFIFIYINMNISYKRLSQVILNQFRQAKCISLHLNNSTNLPVQDTKENIS